MKELKINHFAVLVAIVIQFVIGFLWYGPLFGDAWMEAVGLTEEAILADPADVGDWITNIVSAVVSMYVLAWFFTKLNVTNWFRGALYGFIIGAAFVLLSVKTANMFAKFPYGLAWITGGFTTFGLMVGGAVLGAWTKFEE